MVSRYSWGFISRTFRIDRDGKDFNTEELFRRNASAVLAFPDERPLRGMMNVTYYGNSVADEVNYYIVATDYFQYAVGWACENLENNRSREFAWVLSRTTEWPANSTYAERVANYTALHFDAELMRDTLQSEA
jgi:apolipoprotein D and lipocalin family protein